MRCQCGDFGGIEDVARGVRWSNAQFAAEVALRADRLAAAGIGAGATLIIAHAGTAHFFADLFAVWRLGCTAVVLPEGLTAREFGLLVDFVRPAAVLADRPVPRCRLARFLSYRSRLQMQNPIEDTP